MVKIKILKEDVKGSNDGATVHAFPIDGGPNNDGVYDVSEDLANALINVGDAEAVSSRAPAAPPAKDGKAVIPTIPGIPTVKQK